MSHNVICIQTLEHTHAHTKTYPAIERERQKLTPRMEEWACEAPIGRWGWKPYPRPSSNSSSLSSSGLKKLKESLLLDPESSMICLSMNSNDLIDQNRSNPNQLIQNYTSILKESSIQMHSIESFGGVMTSSCRIYCSATSACYTVFG